MLPMQSENVSLHFFPTPLTARAQRLSFSLCTAAPPSTSLISCPSLFLSISSRCSMYVSVCEPAELPVCLHVGPSVLPDLVHLQRLGISQMPSDKEFLSLLIHLSFPFESSHSSILHSCFHAFRGILNFLGNMELPELEFSA